MCEEDIRSVTPSGQGAPLGLRLAKNSLGQLFLPISVHIEESLLEQELFHNL